MTLSRCQRLFILLTALWLPLQAVAGMTMQFCRHAGTATDRQNVQQTVTPAAEEHCAYHDAAPAQQDPQGQNSCDSCGICHLACSGYMPPSALTTAVATTQQTLQIRPVASLPSHIPEPPQYPPRHSA